MVEENDTPSFSRELALNQPTSLLEMAQRVHDDFVAKGKARAEELESEAQRKHDELISSAKEFHDITILETESNAAAIIEDAQLSAFSLISDAKIKADGIVSGAQGSIVQLEASILKLQEFEAAYRGNLQALVSGAQATLAVAELAVEDTELPAPDSDEVPAAENVNFADALDHAVQSGEDVILVGAVRDVESAEVDAVETPAESEDVHSDDESETDEEEVPESEDDSEEDEDNSDDTETAESDPVIYTLVDETPESVYYDPLAAKHDIDASTVASILGQSGLGADSFHEPVPTIINANPGAGWSLAADEDVDDDDSESAPEADTEDKGEK
jgi:vacuolar-type H+-ATPase subunit H